MIERLQVQIPAGEAGEFSSPELTLAGEAGEFSSPELTLCADSYSMSVPPPCDRSGT